MYVSVKARSFGYLPVITVTLVEASLMMVMCVPIHNDTE
jgi:hypothetical protein